MLFLHFHALELVSDKVKTILLTVLSNMLIAATYVYNCDICYLQDQLFSYNKG